MLVKEPWHSLWSQECHGCTRHAIVFCVNRMHLFFLPSISTDAPSLDWHAMWEMGFYVTQVIEKWRKQIFSIRFRRLCPLAVQANVAIAKQSTSHFASDKSANVLGKSPKTVFVWLSQGVFGLFVPSYKKKEICIPEQIKSSLHTIDSFFIFTQVFLLWRMSFIIIYKSMHCAQP